MEKGHLDMWLCDLTPQPVDLWISILHMTLSNTLTCPRCETQMLLYLGLKRFPSLVKGVNKNNLFCTDGCRKCIAATGGNISLLTLINTFQHIFWGLHRFQGG